MRFCCSFFGGFPAGFLAGCACSTERGISADLQYAGNGALLHRQRVPRGFSYSKIRRLHRLHSAAAAIGDHPLLELDSSTIDSQFSRLNNGVLRGINQSGKHENTLQPGEKINGGVQQYVLFNFTCNHPMYRCTPQASAQDDTL